jgi:DNA-binding XRE family transcriptional regulator
MPPAQVQELVAQVKAWYETHEMLQRDLATKLGVSPTGLCQIFAGINQPSASTALAMIRFLEEQKNMKTATFIDPRATPRPTASDLVRPKTLSAAIDRIEVLEAQLKAAAVASPAKPGATAPTPKPKLADSPTFPTVTTPGANQPNTNPIPVNFEAPPLALLPPDADCPARIQKYLDAMTEDEVRDCLRGEHDPLRLGMTYKELQKRKTLTAIG